MSFMTGWKGIFVAALLVVPAHAGMLSHNTQSVEAGVDQALLHAAVAYDRDSAEASIASTEQRCRFTPSRNPVRPRRNECRLA
jgi:hypothetical protein